MTTPIAAQSPAEIRRTNRVIRLSLGTGVLLFFGVSIVIHNIEPGKPMFDWHAAPPIVHELAPLAMALGLVWLWFWRGKLRVPNSAAVQMSRSLILCAGLEALALGGVYLFFATRDPILAAWTAPAFLLGLLTEPRYLW